MNKHQLKTNVRRKMKLIRTLSYREKLRWAGFVLIVSYVVMWYLKGTH